MKNSRLEELLQYISYCSSEERFDRISEILSRNWIYYHHETDHEALNIIVGDPDRALVTVCAHYDIVPGSCGANDNGSSCAVMLDLCLRQAGDPSVCFVFLDREESGFYGSRLHFSKHHPMITVNLDVIGGGEQIVFHNSAEDLCGGSPLNQMLEDIADSYGAVRTDRLPVCDTDTIINCGCEVVTFSAFPEKDAAYIRDTGCLACNEVIKYMHGGPKDDIEYISFDTMEQVDDMLEEFIIIVRAIASANPALIQQF
ncbi:MAG: Zn-dependent exopeptidase M28 [Lachnospiraceae bacterium]|nr:Zn-dependent exopeptidase M28 [Lachnospiraceae bacterium]